MKTTAKITAMLLVFGLWGGLASATVITLDFEDLTLGQSYSVGDSFTTSGVVITVEEFQRSDGSWYTYGDVTVDTDSGLGFNTAGGSGNELWVSSVNLYFDFDITLIGLELLYGDFGGTLNIELNGDFVNLHDFVDIDNTTIGGTSISVFDNGTPGQSTGTLSVVGTIQSFRIGGGELWIDDVVVIPEPAKTYYVNAAEGSDNNDGLSPETPFATIQKAIDSAYNGDTVLVADGTYTGPGNRDIDFLGKAITVRSESGPNNCIIDCQNSGRGFYFHNGEDANSVLDGLTVTNGYASGSWPECNGGAILCLEASPKITNCIINTNSAQLHGGGIDCWESSPKISNCTISGNSAGDGGGIVCSRYSSPTITNCSITDNTASRGGGIWCWDSDPTITNCTISSNTGYLGGGIHCDGSSPTITNCTFSRNTAKSTDWGGGGILCYKSSPTITNCTFSRNTAKSTDWGGGGILCYESSPTITNCTINGNSALAGGGIFCDLSSPTINNCTISSNTGYLGGGIFCYDNSSPTINNCILWDNLPQQITGSALVAYSNIEAGWPGEGNIDQDPCFAFSTDYHIMPDSPCIDTGDPNYIAGPNETDLDGNPRIIDGDGDANAVADMGAYEYAPNSPSIAVSALSFYFLQDWPKPDPQTLLVRNCGGTPLQWEIVEDCSWLGISPTSGVSTDQINEATLTVDTNGLTPGLYSCTFNVQDPNATNSPVTISVMLHIAALLRVPSQDYPTIQEAINAAVDYDMVLVADGTYTGPGNRDIDFHGKAITVRSESGPENCIIDCNYAGRGFNFDDGEDANSVLEGFTIRGGYMYQGGAIFCDGSSPTIENCIVTGNTGGWGGGVAFYNSDATIINCLISGNKGWDAAGGIYCRDSNPTITNCTISGNSTEGSGGGVYCQETSLTVANCTIIGNSARYGGGIYSYGNLTITNCAISGNSAERSGGGVFCMYSNPKITNCTITGNLAEWGGGIYCGGWWYDYDWQGSSPTITNCILWDNAPDQITGSAVVTYSDVQGGWPGEGNIDADPCFVEPGYWDVNEVWVDGDYHLQSEGWRWDTQRKIWTWDDVTSRCIDAGNPGSPLGAELLSVPVDPNNEWGQNLRINMGAYGGTAEASMPPFNWALLANLTNDGKVDSNDLAAFVNYWLDSGECIPSDLSRNQFVDFIDFALLAQDWFLETNWYVP